MAASSSDALNPTTTPDAPNPEIAATIPATPKSSTTINIRVVRTLQIEVNLDETTVDTVKAVIQDKMDIPAHRQRLSADFSNAGSLTACPWPAILVQGEVSLAAYGVYPGCTLEVEDAVLAD